MVRVVDQLVAAGLANRVADPNDGRRTLVQATDTGKQLLIEGRRRRVRVLAHAIGALPREDLATLKRAAVLLDGVMSRES